MQPGSSRRDAVVDLLLALTCAVAVTAPMLGHGTPDEETYEFSIFSTLYFVKALVAGGDPFFTPDFAFGVQIPNGQWVLRFPASLAAASGSARLLYSSIWIGGQLLFVFFLLRLLRYVSASWRVRAAAAATAVLSFSNLGYFYIDDWPEVFLGWCLVPFCLWSAVGLLEESRTGAERLGKLSMCALAFGMLVANGHPLHTFIWFTVLMLFFLPVVAARPRWLVPLAVAAALAALGGLDIVVQTLGGLGSSHGTFNPTGDPTRYPVLTANDYLGFLQPLRSMAATGWSGLMQPAYGRRPFYGAVFFVLALGGSVTAIVRPHLFATLPNRAVVRAFGIAFLGTVCLTVAPAWAVFNLVGEGWHYKDGQTLFAVVIAAMVLEALLQRGWRRLVAALLVVQVAQAVVVAAPLVRTALANDRHVLFARDVRPDAFWDQPAVAALRGRARVMAAGTLDTELFSNLRAADGVVAVTDFVLEDIAMVNGWYRGTVTPGFGPSDDPRYGGYQTVLRWSNALRYLDRPALDALGITHVLAFAGESNALRGALGLDEAGTVPVAGPQSPISVLHNPRAWERAVLIGAGGPRDVTPRAGCAERVIWCADFAPLAAARVPGARLHREGARFVVDLPASHPGGYVLLTQALANGWVARVDGAARPVRPFHDVFAAVDVRPSDRVVELHHDSSTQAWLLAVGLGQMVLCLAVAAVASARARRSHEDGRAR